MSKYINNSSISALLWRILSSMNVGNTSYEKNFPRGGKKPAVALPRKQRFRVCLQSVFWLVLLVSILLKDMYGTLQGLVFMYLLWFD